MVTEEESAAMKDCETVLHRVEQFITAYQNGTGALLKKAVFHSDITPQRIDLIIQGLLKIRHTILTGEGVKNALEAR